jgi:radical SAM superfamily enzyme YgiQ (UPF0313 family)
MRYDVLIVDSLISYQNIAFDFGITNLRYNDEVMTLQNLMKHYYPRKSKAFANNSLNLEKCGKLNGILLYDYLSKLGFKCALISNVIENEKTLESLLSEGARAVIVSTTWAFGIQEVKKATKLIREYDTKVPIIAGGVLIFNSYLIYNQRSNKDFDYNSTQDQFFLVNENPELSEDIDVFIIDRCGLKTLVKVLSAIKDKENFYGFNNTAYYRNGNLIINPQHHEKIDLNNQVISWNEIQPEYISQILPVQLSLGCNFGCKFCNFFHQRHCYSKSKENIRRELRYIRSRPEVKMIRFVDDSMPANILRDLCEVMIEEQLNIPWTTFLRLDALTEKNIALMQKVNCVDVQVGIESGDNRILENMGKKATADKYLQILDDLAALDISCRSSFIIGYPGENQESISNTIDFLNKLPTDTNAAFYVGIAPFILLPLSPIYYESQRKPYNLKGYLIDWKHDSMEFADVPNYLRQIFLSVKDEVLFVYTGDPVDINWPRQITKKLKISRQNYQKGIVKNLPTGELDVLKTDLKNSLEKFQQIV